MYDKHSIWTPKEEELINWALKNKKRPKDLLPLLPNRNYNAIYFKMMYLAGLRRSHREKMLSNSLSDVQSAVCERKCLRCRQSFKCLNRKTNYLCTDCKEVNGRECETFIAY